jgi:hypothetical protein
MTISTREVHSIIGYWELQIKITATHHSLFSRMAQQTWARIGVDKNIKIAALPCPLWDCKMDNHFGTQFGSSSKS